jgi:hypothetical protein
MRALGFALLAASLVLGTGGVAYRGTAQTQAPTRAQSAAQDEAICPAQPSQEEVRHARISAAASSAPVVSLNAHGFNYSRPGDPLPTKVRVSDEAPAAPAD